MALTQAQWYAKLQSWVPSWFFEDPYYSKAVWDGLAKVFSDAEQNLEDHVAQTFILQAIGNFLDLLGDERNFRRRQYESDTTYALRVQNLLNQSNPPALAKAINNVLIRGVVTIVEHGKNEGIFCNRDTFLNRGQVFTYIFYNTFTLIVDRQRHVPYMFLETNTTGDFIGQSYLGSSESSQTVFDLLAEVVNNLKAAGTLYRVFERNN